MKSELALNVHVRAQVPVRALGWWSGYLPGWNLHLHLHDHLKPRFPSPNSLSTAAPRPAPIDNTSHPSPRDTTHAQFGHNPMARARSASATESIRSASPCHRAGAVFEAASDSSVGQRRELCSARLGSEGAKG